MSVWKGAWYLAKHELYKDRWKSLISLAFIGYLLLFSVPLFSEALSDEDAAALNWATDFIYLSLLPCLGFLMNQTMVRYWKNNAYTQKMAQWRTLPISSKQIALGRLIQLTIVLFAALFIFFALQYISVRMMGTEILISHFVSYALFWFGYSLAIAATYVYFEVGHSGKTYLFMSFVYIFIFLLISIGLAVFKVGNVVLASLQAIERGNGWIVLIALAIGILTLFVGTKLIEKRLENRSYTN